MKLREHKRFDLYQEIDRERKRILTNKSWNVVSEIAEALRLANGDTEYLITAHNEKESLIS